MNTTAAEHPVRARLGRWPDDADVAHLVLLDHHMVPDRHHVESWVADARAQGAAALRTGALFPPSSPAFLAAGFEVIDTLSLLELDLGEPAPAPGCTQPAARLRRLRSSQLDAAALVDRRSFPAPWANNAAALHDIVTATPRYRARCVHHDGQMVAFSISGRASTWGYLQRVAVDPSLRRCGLARLLVGDALDWMRRRNVERVLVNTATDNIGALTLYRSLGFVERPERLTILERSLR
ncbi:MAG TPA: GNAT family N-acetyltransferase [Ilumatobacteraceae bacterium]|nr:GNAT family N-acetyltransferase [Ilumatobacteraceae bacterium]